MIENYSYDQGKIILIILTNMIGLINNNMLSIETSKDHIHHFFIIIHANDLIISCALLIQVSNSNLCVFDQACQHLNIKEKST